MACHSSNCFSIVWGQGNAPLVTSVPSSCYMTLNLHQLYFLAVKAVQGNYTEWSAWSDCSTTCGRGEKFRTRNCTNPPPAFGGMDCSFIGMDRDVQKCEMTPCAGTYRGLPVQHLTTY